MIKIIYLITALSQTHQLELNSWDQCLDMAEKITLIQPSYEVWCCRENECVKQAGAGSE